MGFLDIIVAEMLLVPGVEADDSGQDDFELRVGGKAFAHVHKPDRIDIRLPPDIKENVLARGMATRSPDPHDREGWVALKLGPNPQFPTLTSQTGRVLGVPEINPFLKIADTVYQL